MTARWPAATECASPDDQTKRNHTFFSRCSTNGNHIAGDLRVAWPIRHLLRKAKDVTTLLGNVTGVDRQGKRVLLEDGVRSPTTRWCSPPVPATPIRP